MGGRVGFRFKEFTCSRSPSHGAAGWNPQPLHSIPLCSLRGCCSVCGVRQSTGQTLGS
ncbi:uncharacterized protein [Physcomitrium patens]|uniref:uncharacterized protein isoform X4 n=1 Tax=Physcomitrium patens TaxID=3218 RepID=UPI003CCDA4ED